MAPSSGGSALPRVQIWSEDGLGGPQPPSWSRRRSFVMGFWDADGENMVQASLCFLAVVGDGGKLRQCSSSRGRLVSAVARRLRPGSQEYLDVVVKVEWHAWRTSWAYSLHAVSKYAPAAEDSAAKVERQHCKVATGNGADASDEETVRALGVAEGPAADDDGAAYKVAYQSHEDFLENPIRRFNIEGAAYLLKLQDHEDFLEGECADAVVDRNCCNHAFEVTGPASSCRPDGGHDSCLAVLGQVGARVPQFQDCKVDATAGRQPGAQVCKLTAHVQGPSPCASRSEVLGSQVSAVQDCAGSDQGDVQVRAEQMCLLSGQVLQAPAAETHSVQVCQESSGLCPGRCPSSLGQVRCEDVAAIDQHFFGQVRRPLEYAQATYVSEAGSEVSCCCRSSSVEGTECHVTAGPCLELLGQVDAQEPQVQACLAAQVHAKKGIGHDWNCCSHAFEVTGLASSCRTEGEKDSCLTVLGQVGAQVPKFQDRKVDATAGRQPEAQVCVLTAHVRGPLPCASRLEASGSQVPEVQDCAGSGQGEVQVRAEQMCMLSCQVLQAPAAETNTVQVCQESSELCPGRCPSSQGQVRFEDVAAIDQHFFGQARCPLDCAQATYASEAGFEVSCCCHSSSVEGPCLEPLGQVDAQKPKVQVCHAAQVDAKRDRGHDWRRPPPASRASLPPGQVWCTHAAACGAGLPCSISPLASSLPGPGAQVVQVSSRCQLSRGQVKPEDTAAIDSHLCPGLVASGCHCRCLLRQGQVRCPVDSVQATRAAAARFEALHLPCQGSFEEAVEPCQTNLDHHTLDRPVGQEWSKDPRISSRTGFHDMHRPHHCCTFHRVNSLHSAFGEAAGQVWSKDPSISDGGTNGSTSTLSPRPFPGGLSRTPCWVPLGTSGHAWKQPSSFSTACLPPSQVRQTPVSEVWTCQVRGASLAVAIAQCEDDEFIYFQQCSQAAEAPTGRAHAFSCFSGCLRTCVDCCSALWNGRPYAGVRVGEAAHPGPDGNGLEAILGPGLLESVKTAIQKLVAQAVKQSLGQAGLPAGSAKANKRRKRKVKKAAAKKGGAGGTQGQVPPTSVALQLPKTRARARVRGRARAKVRTKPRLPPRSSPPLLSKPKLRKAGRLLARRCTSLRILHSDPKIGGASSSSTMTSPLSLRRLTPQRSSRLSSTAGPQRFQ